MSAKNDQLIYDAAIQAGFTPTSAKFVVAQARNESGNYTSSVYNNNNNTFGMKFVGQPLATMGTIAPLSERSAACKSGGKCVNSDYYAKYNSVADSAKDAISRLYNITIKGVTPSQIKASKTPEEFAQLLKTRGYFGQSAGEYAATLRSLLKRIQVVEFIDKNKKLLLMGAILIGVSLGYYVYHKKP